MTYSIRIPTVAKQAICATSLILLLVASVSADAGTKSPARTALDQGNHKKVVSLLEPRQLKTAEEHYLLGRAYHNLGDREQAAKSWAEALLVNKNLAKKDRWTFLFPPGKKLKAKEKSQLKAAFESEYRQLSASLIRTEQNRARAARNQAARSQAASNRAAALADAKSHTIASKQNLADRHLSKPPQSQSGGGAPIPKWAFMLVGLIVALVISYAVYKAMSNKSPDSARPEGAASFGTKRFHVGHDDEYFVAGPFWFEGRYFHDHEMFYDHYGYYYTNRMYMDNYEQYGFGQGRDPGLDREIMRDIAERDSLRAEAAAHQAASDHAQQDAAEAEQRRRDYQEAAASFDEPEEFEDDVDAGDSDSDDDAA